MESRNKINKELYMNNEDKYWSIFNFSAKNNVLEIAKYIEAGEELNVMNELENTPLHIAFMYKSYDVARLLIEAGADINAKNDMNRMPFITDILESY